MRAAPGEPERFPWEVSVSVPFTYNTNVANAETNKGQAFHADPTITIAKKWGIGSGVQFFMPTYISVVKEIVSQPHSLRNSPVT